MALLTDMSRSIAEKLTLWKFVHVFEIARHPAQQSNRGTGGSPQAGCADCDQVRHFIAAFFGTIPARFQIHTGAEKWQLLRILKTM